MCNGVDPPPLRDSQARNEAVGELIERSQARASSDPTILYCWDYRFYVQEGDRVVAEVAWVEAVKRSSSNEAK
jgi:hypothetical protein